MRRRLPRRCGARITRSTQLTDPRLLDGIGNSYSDEILHRAGLSPLALTQKLGDADMATLFAATRTVLAEWTDGYGPRSATVGRRR